MKALTRLIKKTAVIFASWLGYIIISVLGRSIRWDAEAIKKSVQSLDGHVIFAFWHNRLLLMPYIYKRFFKNRQIVALASRSKDGEYIARILHHFSFAVIRGSTTKGGAAGLRAIAAYVNKGYDAGITPDGPRGPKYSVQPGAVALAKLTGRPVIPAAYTASRYWELNTWDNFLIPHPFSRCSLILGEPIYVEDYEDISHINHNLHRNLVHISAKADKKYLKHSK